MTENERKEQRQIANKAHGQGYLLGLVLATSIHCGFQDIMGKDNYINFLRKNWITVPWPIWITLIVICLWIVWGRAREQ
jgi:hypothetical protein